MSIRCEELVFRFFVVYVQLFSMSLLSDNNIFLDTKSVRDFFTPKVTRCFQRPDRRSKNKLLLIRPGNYSTNKTNKSNKTKPYNHKTYNYKIIMLICSSHASNDVQNRSKGGLRVAVFYLQNSYDICKQGSLENPHACKKRT